MQLLVLAVGPVQQSWPAALNACVLLSRVVGLPSGL